MILCIARNILCRLIPVGYVPQSLYQASTVLLNLADRGNRNTSHRTFSHEESDLTPNENNVAERKEPRRRTVLVPQITLILPDNTIKTTTLVTAEKIAKRRKYNLMKIEDHSFKSERTVYKLVNITDFLEEEIPLNNTTTKVASPTKLKHEKQLKLTSLIADHDLVIKINNVKRLLNKMHPIKITVTNNNVSQDATVAKIKSMLKDEAVLTSEVSKPAYTTLYFTFASKEETTL